MCYANGVHYFSEVKQALHDVTHKSDPNPIPHKCKVKVPVACHAGREGGGGGGESSGVALLIYNFGNRWGIGGQNHAPAALHSEKSPGSNFQRWVLGPVWRRVEEKRSLAPTGLRTTNHPARSESLYLLRYSAAREPAQHNGCGPVH